MLLPPLLLSALLTIGLLLLATHLWLEYTYSYWQRRRISFIKPLPFVGNLKDLLLLRISFGELFRQLYSNAEIKDAPLAGIYILHTPALLIRDPKLINLVLIKNFNMFLNRYEAADPYHDDMGSLCLPLAKYPVWRQSRKRMSIFFTSGQMKYNMYPQMLIIAKELEKHIERNFLETTDKYAIILEVKELCALFTIDLTSLLSYGIRANCLQNADAPFRKQTKELFKPGLLKTLHFFTIFFLPHLADRIKAKVFTKQYADFMHKTVNDIEQKRLKEKTPTNFMELLLNFRDEFSDSKHFTNQRDFVASQAAIFMLAGFETSSSLIAFTLYELAKQPAIQHRLRLEIRDALNEKLTYVTYERLTNMRYLGMVVSEALRLYPAASFINRECTPAAGRSGFSLRPLFDYFVPAGMPAYISILGLHRDPKYWPNPKHFDPERFSEKNAQLHNPMTYIPFGSGPHSCIGSRLGVLQVKLGLVHILKDYAVKICSRTVSEIIFDPKSFMLQAVGGIYLQFVQDRLIGI